MTTGSGNAAIALSAAGVLLPWLIVPAAAAAPADETVQMGGDTAHAPVLAAGVHEVAISDQAGFFAVERTIPGSTIWVGETVITANPANGDLLLAAVKENGDDCGWSSPGVVDDLIDDHEFRTGIVNSGDCTDDDVIYIRNEPGSGSNFNGEHLQVAIWEEPPAEDPSLLPPASTEVRWDGSKREEKGAATLGTDFGSAPELSDGRWQVRVQPGRTALFRVPLAWGQHVQVGLSQPGFADGPGFRDARSVEVEPLLITPLGGEGAWAEALASRSGTRAPSTSLYVYDSPTTGGAVSPVVQWRNRSEPTTNPAAFPGTYYVSLRVDGKAELPDVVKDGIDLALDVQVFGEPGGEPYAEAAPKLPDLAAARGAKGSDDAGSGSAASSDEPDWGVVGGLGAIAVGMAAAGGGLLARWRRVTGRSR
ncbi:hypothetical protein ACLM5J_04845 [Nocardioides sp. Bht2]|uniref:hypothetical protein n=1 Tax=Nocardioides sp. Bht2 TaxID=3392297 RepID=UPI0039B5D114